MEPLTTVAYADTFFAERLHTELWDASTPENKRKAVNHASDDIRKYFVLHDEAFVDPERTIAVAQLQSAVCLQAIYLLRTNPAEYPEILTKGMSSGSAGPLNATFDKSFVPDPLGPDVEITVGELGEYIGPSEFGTARTAPLIV